MKIIQTIDTELFYIIVNDNQIIQLGLEHAVEIGWATKHELFIALASSDYTYSLAPEYVTCDFRILHIFETFTGLCNDFQEYFI